MLSLTPLHDANRLVLDMTTLWKPPAPQKAETSNAAQNNYVSDNNDVRIQSVEVRQTVDSETRQMHAKVNIEVSCLDADIVAAIIKDYEARKRLINKLNFEGKFLQIIECGDVIADAKLYDRKMSNTAKFDVLFARNYANIDMQHAEELLTNDTSEPEEKIAAFRRDEWWTPPEIEKLDSAQELLHDALYKVSKYIYNLTGKQCDIRFSNEAQLNEGSYSNLEHLSMLGPFQYLNLMLVKRFSNSSTMLSLRLLLECKISGSGATSPKDFDIMRTATFYTNAMLQCKDAASFKDFIARKPCLDVFGSKFELKFEFPSDKMREDALSQQFSYQSTCHVLNSHQPAVFAKLKNYIQQHTNSSCSYPKLEALFDMAEEVLKAASNTFTFLN